MYNAPTKLKKVNILSDIGLLVPEFGLLCDQKKVLLCKSMHQILNILLMKHGDRGKQL